MSRLTARFNELSGDNRKALVAYIVAGDPTPGMTVELMHGMVEAGVDVIELGVPFTDPEAEGPVIQAAHERALQHSISLGDTLKMVSGFRERDLTTPVVLMGYLNPVERMGYQSFAEAAGKLGVDGLITVNLPPEEAGALTVTLEENGVDPIYLLAPTTTEARAAKICAASRGFVYYVSLKGT
ncbi:MAG: tryptophan synthase subunit alpha, partial [Pseudomonadales bacterium]